MRVCGHLGPAGPPQSVGVHSKAWYIHLELQVNCGGTYARELLAQEDPHPSMDPLQCPRSFLESGQGGSLAPPPYLRTLGWGRCCFSPFALIHSGVDSHLFPKMMGKERLSLLVAKDS